MKRKGFFFLPFFFLAQHLYPLAIYTAREGRICDNCHMNPFQTDRQQEWPNPELSKRKCNLSCSTCHVDTHGGGIRRVAGRYLNASTLPYWGNYEKRPYWDYLRNLSGTIKRLKDTLFPPPNKPKAMTEAEWEALQKELKKKAQGLPTHDRTHLLPPFWTISDPFAFGRAFNAKPDNRIYSPLFGVYGNLNADPFFLLSGDFRTVYFRTKEKEVFFPMQAELGASLHPIEHFTLAFSGGILGSPQASKIPMEKRTYVRQAILMLHELPYQSYLKIGAFVPGFGLRLEDHTAYVNRFFERNMNKRNNTVYGAEVGLFPNYPYFSFSTFTNMGQEYRETQGIGHALSLGWRDLLFGGGISYLVKKRSLAFGGDFQGISLDFYINLGRIWFTNPIVFMGELIWGERKDSNGFRQSFGHFFEISYLILNGLNLKANHHFYDPSFSQRNTESGRLGLGFDFTPLPFIRFTFEYQWVWLIPQNNEWRKGSFINPADMVFADQIMWVTHVYF